MSKFLLIFMLMPLLSFATVDFNFEYTFHLKKDQIGEAVIKKDYPVTFPKEGVLRFRWTLYQNERLVVLVDYEGFKTQYVLEPRYGLDTIKLYLTGDYARMDKRAFVYLSFKAFDAKKRIATILAQFADPENRLNIKITKPKK